MKSAGFKILVVFLVIFLISTQTLDAQCSICTRTAEQLGEKSAKGLNAGVLYLAFAPLALITIIGFRWWKKNKDTI